MTKALVILLAVAIVLGIIAFFAVFTPGTSVISGSSNGTASGTLSFNGLVNGTGTSPASSTGASPSISGFTPGQNGSFATTFSYPYVMNWNEGQTDFSVTAASWNGGQLTLALKVQIGNVGGCIPIDLRLVTDETGDVAAPAQSTFAFPDTNSCNGTPNKTYDNQLLTFTVAPNTPMPLLFTTGGTSNDFFQLSTTTDSGIQIQLPGTAG